MSINSQITATVTKYFKERPNVAAVYLYGSQARGDEKQGSDFDLAVLFSKKKKPTNSDMPQVTFIQELTKHLQRKVDVQDLKNCRVDFAHRVISEGRLLISNNEGERMEFEENILQRYFDLKPMFEEYYKSLSDIAKKGEIGVRHL